MNTCGDPNCDICRLLYRWGTPAVTPLAMRPCFTCGKPTPDEVCEQHKPVASVTEQAEYLASVEEYHKDSQWTFVQPVACTPDDQPETYEARRKRIAAERNPGQGSRIKWAWPDEPVGERAAGIARAVDRLSQVEHRVGAARFSPEER